jgi:hypothetical protein
VTTLIDAFRRSPEMLSDAELVEQADLLKLLKAKRGAATNLADASRYLFRTEPMRHALVWLEALEAIERREITRLCVIAPPGHAKSTYHSIIFPTWYLGRHYNASLIGVTTTDGLGTLYGDTVRTVIEDENFAKIFPGVEPDKERGWAKDGFFIMGPKPRGKAQKDASMVYTGAGGPVIGRRADGIIIDDAIDEATARSETLLEARKLWIRRSVFSRSKPGSWRIVCGTLWTEDDVVDSTMRTGEYVTIHMQAQSPNEHVAARLWIPNGVSWRPSNAVVG